MCAIAAVVLTGCGYVGDPLPPALHIPKPVTDLTAIQHADTIEIRFTPPTHTTEDLVIRQFGAVDVRIGPAPKEVNLDAWASGARAISAPLPEPGKAVMITIPAAEWAGREVLIAARLISTRRRESAWSNAVRIAPRAALPPPALKAELHPEGVRISWPSGQARVFREEQSLGVATTTEYIDRTVENGKTYSYRAQAVDGSMESALSAPVTITVQDKFPPKPPAGVTAVAALESVELAWEPNGEPDLKGYRVFRSTGSGEFAVIANSIDTPSFSDRTAASSGLLRYRITAMDRTGNESAPSTIVEVNR